MSDTKASRVQSVLASSYALHTLSITSNTKIRKSVLKVLSELKDAAFASPVPIMIITAAQPQAAGKLVSIVEITKRELDKSRKPWYQYTSVEGVLPTRKSRTGDSEDGRGSGGANGHEKVNKDRLDEPKGSETGGQEITPLCSNFIRPVPMMTTYLAPVSIPQLSLFYSEQKSSTSISLASAE